MPSAGEIKRQNELLAKQQDILQSIQNTLSGATSTANNLSRAMQSAVSYASQLGGDMDNTARNTNEAADHAQELGSNLRDAADSGIDAMKRFGSSMGQAVQDTSSTAFSTITQTMGAIGEITQSIFTLKFLAGFSALFGLILSNWEKTTVELRSALGTVFTDPQVNNNLNQFFRRFEKDAIESGLAMADIANTAQAFSSEFGLGVSQSAQLAFNIEDGAKALGVSSGIMSNIVGGFSVAFDISTDQAQTLSEQVGLLSAMNDVAPRQVLQDIAESTEEMARFSAGGVKNFIATAIQARKLGMSIKDVANTMNGLLNFEDSLNKELQASIMLGRRINLNEARRAAFAGDTSKAMQAIASQLEGVNLEGLSPLALQAVADAANMSVSQIMKLTKGTDKLGDVGTEGMDSFDTSMINAKSAMTKMAKLTAEFDAKMRSLAANEGDKYFKTIEGTFNHIMDSGFFESATGFLGDFNTGIQSIAGILFGDLPSNIGGDFFVFNDVLRKELGKTGEDAEKLFSVPATKGAALVDLAKNLGKSFLNTVLKFFKIDDDVDSLMVKMKKYFTEIPSQTDSSVNESVQFLDGLWYRVKEIFKKIGEKLGLTGEDGLFSKVFGGEGMFGKKISEFFQSIKKTLTDAIAKLFTESSEDAGESVEGGGGGGGLFSGIIEKILGKDFNFNTIIDKIKANTNMEDLKKSISDLFTGAINPQAILEGFTNIDFTSLSEKLKENTKKLKEKAGGAFTTGKSFFMQVLGLDKGELGEELATQIQAGVDSLQKDPEFKDKLYEVLAVEDIATRITKALTDAFDELGKEGGAIDLLTKGFKHSLKQFGKFMETLEMDLSSGRNVITGIPKKIKFKGDSSVMEDFISRPGQSPERFSPDDTLIGTKGKLVDMEPMSNNQNRTNQLLEENNRLLNRLMSDGLPVRRA